MYPMLLPSEIRNELHTDYFARRIYYLPEATSVNDIATELARRGEEDGTLIVCDYQSRGRGRLSRNWESPKGKDLLFSLILRPKKNVTSVLGLTLAFSFTIAEVLDSYLPTEVAVKWPNDVLADRKKISGILAEGSSRGKSTEFVVVGIGINVNTKKNELSPSLRKTAISCRMVIGRDLQRVELLATLLSELEKTYSRFLIKGFDFFVNQYNSRLIVKGETVSFNKKGVQCRGRIEGVNRDGGLIVGLPDGRRIVLYECEIF